MKKLIIAVLLVAIIAAGAFGQSGVIRELTGDVELKHAGATAFVAATSGARVASNTIISTGFRSTAIVEIGSSLITVRPLTRLTLDEIQSAENTENVSINLQAGRVRVEVQPPAGTRANFTVQSPSSTASVRGTIFEMDTENLSTIEGKVLLAGNAGPPVMVFTGNTTFSGSGGVPTDPVEEAQKSTQPPTIVGVQVDFSSQPPVVDVGGGGSASGDIDISIGYYNN